MRGFGDKLLALIVFKCGKLYLRRRYGRFVPSRRATLAGVLGLALAGAAVAVLRRPSPPPSD